MMNWPKFLFSRDRMKIVKRFLEYQRREFQRARLGVFELALLIEKAWTSGLDSEEIDVSLNYYEAKHELERKSRKPFLASRASGE